jgi:simple sugar transport system ATP-binding protein
MARFDIRAPGPRTLVRQLSGGNVQKVVLARELSSDPRLVVAASPTRGLDVGATEYVRSVLLDAARRGAGVLLISEDLDEIIELSNRIAVLYGGRVVGVMDSADATYEHLGMLMAGAAS